MFWNIAWDVGFSLGAVGLGAIAAASSFGYAFWVLPFLWLSGLVVAAAADRPRAESLPPRARSTTPT